MIVKQVQAVTKVGGGNFSTPVIVTVLFGTTENATTATNPPVIQSAKQDDTVLFSLAVLPSFIIVSVAIAVFSLLYYRRYRRRKMKKRRFRETIANHQSQLQHSTSQLVTPDEPTACQRFEALSQQRERTKSNKYIFGSTLVENSALSQLESLSQHIPKEILLTQDNIQLSNVIGEGEFGQVYKGYMKTKYQTDVVAVKTLRALSSVSEVKLLMKEIVKMVNFDHPNVMTLTGVILVEGGAPLLVMPYMVKGTLLTYVRENKDQFFVEDDNAEAADQVDEISKTLIEFSRQIALGMQYLAKNKVVHRDLAARNCLLDMCGTVKVADFGLSEDMYSTNYFRQGKSSVDAVETKVPIRWMPLESIEEGLYNEKSDVWSYGVTVWEIFTCGKVPYHGISCMALPRLLRAGEHLEKPYNTACSEVLTAGELLECCSTAKAKIL
ncbi:Tyrosine-protein kinase transforming protein SEA [Geodia barretti]|uniref:Tyrosine-protein kinase transforming protein SEA n=1 Tax=Geodia barretti TaxID=519541 RepID=A0AA35SK31_GEOBA|nr:Tyrosine-protein kinase transforming protein SEA [Geodia barretti]